MNKNIFLVGIKGVAMSGLAVILKQMGHNVSGADVPESFITEDFLTENHIRIHSGFVPEKLPPNVDLVSYSPAHQGNQNPVVQEAIKRGVQVMNQPELIEYIMKDFKYSIAVCGCHGKTTTSALLAYTMNHLHYNPSYLVGAPTFDGMWGAWYGKGEYFIVEADEYAVNPPEDKTSKFLYLNPTTILATNIDYDHPDIFETIDDTKKVFDTFFKKRTSKEGYLVVCADNAPLREVYEQYDKDSYVTYGFAIGSDLFIHEIMSYSDHTEFQLTYKRKKLGKFSVSLYGEKNISNAAGVVLTLLLHGFKPSHIRDAMANFSGPKRRFEFIKEVNEIHFFDDYAHHPAEIESVIASARMRFPHNRIVIVFQPHTYSRTFSLKEQFVEALLHADKVYVAPIFASARENSEDFPVTSKDLQSIAESEGTDRLKAYDSNEDLLHDVSKELKTGDIVFTMGAGDIYHLANDIIEGVKTNQSP